MQNKDNYGIVRGFNSHLHASLLPHLGQLQSQFRRGAIHWEHCVYSAKSSLKSIPLTINYNDRT
ncbi:MAG: hypothetical protein OEL56_02325 [Nitrosopumilus sp.]|nr:hypothetical protein [Nitrosopumilus sp.]MDH3489264.1 hypothetical protein [Nitrosopumilus sp.]MDH3564028.1 hypothetical protein [Nitrosopumilus sp.]